MLLKTLALLSLAFQGNSLPLNDENIFTSQNHNISPFYDCFKQEYIEPCLKDLMNKGYNLTAFKEELEKEKESHRYNLQLTFNSYLWEADEYQETLDSKKEKQKHLVNAAKKETIEYKNIEKDIEELRFLIKSVYTPYQYVFNKEMYPFNHKLSIVQEFLDKQDNSRKSFLNGKTRKEINEENLEKVRTIVKNYNLTYPDKQEDKYTCD